VAVSQSAWFNRALRRWAKGQIDLEGDPLKMMLVGPGYDFDQRDDFVGSVPGTPGGEEIVVVGYDGGFGGAGRKLLVGKTLSMRASTDELLWDADDVDYGALGGGGGDVPVDAAIIVFEHTTDADSELVYYVKFPQRMTNGLPFPVRFAADGIWALENEIILV
jgi:hypothetical protein